MSESSGGNISSLIQFGQGLQIGGTLLSGVAGYVQAERKAEIASRNAKAFLYQGEAEAVRLRRDRLRRMGRARASIGAAGVTVDGTPLDVLADEAMTALEDEMLVRFSARERAREQELRADMIRERGLGTLIEGSTRAAGGILQTDFGMSLMGVDPASVTGKDRAAISNAFNF